MVPNSAKSLYNIKHEIFTQSIRVFVVATEIKNHGDKAQCAQRINIASWKSMESSLRIRLFIIHKSLHKTLTLVRDTPVHVIEAFIPRFPPPSFHP